MHAASIFLMPQEQMISSEHFWDSDVHINFDVYMIDYHLIMLWFYKTIISEPDSFK